MTARISTKTPSRAPCSIMQKRARRSSLSACRRIARKTYHSRIRQPLAIKNILNDARHETLVASAPIRLPRSLPRPQVRVVDRTHIESAYPELAKVPTDYIRKGLISTGPECVPLLTHT